MSRNWTSLAVPAACVMFLGACAAQPNILVDTGSAVPGTTVTRGGREVRLLGTPVEVGRPLPSTTLIDAATWQVVDLAKERGRVLFLSVILSVDAAV